MLVFSLVKISTEACLAGTAGECSDGVEVRGVSGTASTFSGLSVCMWGILYPDESEI
jgi:hypothetical protein